MYYDRAYEATVVVVAILLVIVYIDVCIYGYLVTKAFIDVLYQIVATIIIESCLIVLMYLMYEQPKIVFRCVVAAATASEHSVLLLTIHN
ncbi:MAG TPA: hypothetical protein VE619_02245 [Nitrososphaeraceae archaeon]|nr:hypothetical protein [Nitrososphaeraceae archaeon]